MTGPSLSLAQLRTAVARLERLDARTFNMGAYGLAQAAVDSLPDPTGAGAAHLALQQAILAFTRAPLTPASKEALQAAIDTFAEQLGLDV